MAPRLAVVGCGLIGSAAARHLAAAGLAPVLIGPDEPSDKRRHRGVFGSHYDEGRITRKIATHPFWAEASRASIARYGEIERASGIRFFSEVGALMLGEGGGSFMASARNVAAGQGIPHEPLDRRGLAQNFPELEVPADWAALWERDRAGHLSPRKLIAAQVRAATSAGARRVNATVAKIEERSGEVVVHADGRALRFDKVLVAAGAMTDHVLGRTPKFRVCGRTVALIELDDREAARLARLPSMVMGTSELHYVLPPIRYPDGKVYMKIGGDPDDLVLSSPGDIGEWFRSGGRPTVRDGLAARFREFFPGVKVTALRMDACATTWTPDLLPEIALHSPRIAVAAAGNGAGAKCSDELGRRGAALLAAEINERMVS